MTEKEKMLSGKFFLPSDSQLKKERLKNQLKLKIFNKLLPANTRSRKWLISRIFSKVGKMCSIYPPFYCDYGYNIKIGDYFFANINCTIIDVAPVNIGNHVMLGPGVMILTALHPKNALERANGYVLGNEVYIEDHVWIGAGAIINPGVRIGNHSIIASGSVVTHNIPEYVLAAGSPCTIKHTLLDKQFTNKLSEDL